MLKWNAGKVRNLSGTEIWLFIVARVLLGFGLGVLSVKYFPKLVSPLGFPARSAGVLLLVIAAKGMFRPNP